MPAPRLHVSRLLVLTTLVCMTSCGPTPVSDPIPVLLDRERDPARRLAAARQINSISDTPDPAHTVSVLHRLLWSDSQPTDLRLWAMDQLIEHDPNSFWRIAPRRIREVDLWPVLNPLIDRAVQRGNPDFTPALVRSYARTSIHYSDAERPERAAIEALNPDQTLEQSLWNVFASRDDAITTSARVDAWSLSHRLFGVERTRALLRATDSRHPLILDLQAAAWLDVLPANREGVLWLMQVREENGGEFWTQAQQLAEELDASQRRGLELRHLPVLIASDNDALNQDMASALAGLTRWLAGSAIAEREEAGIAMQLPSERLADHASALCFADILTIRRILDALSDRAFVASLFRQADLDMADTSTEHGGVLLDLDGQLVAKPFFPVIRAHDQKFFSSDALVKQMYTGVAHYHFHAQQHMNEAFAGPGVGDLKFVESLRANAVVFTFLDRDTLGVDYYQPGGVVIDLGVIRR